MRSSRALEISKSTLELLDSTGILGIYKRLTYPLINKLFFTHLVFETRNFANLTWMGVPIWQNVLDLWVIQEVISEIRPKLLIETGTHEGGSAHFYANLFDLIGSGNVLSIDIQDRRRINHPRVDYLLGDSTSPSVLSEVEQVVSAQGGPVMVILDSDHSEDHVARELEAYSKFVTTKSFMLVQDGVIDRLPIFQFDRPGPYNAILRFLEQNREFEVDKARSNKFLITHHPMGWLRKN